MLFVNQYQSVVFSFVVLFVRACLPASAHPHRINNESGGKKERRKETEQRAAQVLSCVFLFQSFDVNPTAAF
jgi:hypothetical protein